MDKQTIANQLLTLKDLAKRWRYRSVNGARKRLRFDDKAPKPLTHLNNRLAVYWLPDIERYEQDRGRIDASLQRYTFYQNREEWKTKTRKQKEAQRGSPYSDEEWRKIEQTNGSL